MAKQDRLPGTGDAGIPEIEEAAAAYVKFRDKRMKLLKDEVEARVTLLGAMKTHRKQTYSYDGLEVRIVPGEEKIKVVKEKEAEGDTIEVGEE